MGASSKTIFWPNVRTFSLRGPIGTFSIRPTAWCHGQNETEVRKDLLQRAPSEREMLHKEKHALVWLFATVFGLSLCLSTSMTGAWFRFVALSDMIIGLFVWEVIQIKHRRVAAPKDDTWKFVKGLGLVAKKIAKGRKISSCFGVVRES